VSVDCGIKAVDFTAKAREAGVDVIITDHHRPGDTLPEAVALLNPVLKESGYPYPSLAGVGVVFKLLQALLEKRGKSAQLPHYAKLVAIGTIADVADLRGENRLLVKLGLKGLEKVSNCWTGKSARAMSGSGSLPGSTPPAAWEPQAMLSGSSFRTTPANPCAWPAG
jgi:single-stranded DNA-specific DHH superfamily exonuclease